MYQWLYALPGLNALLNSITAVLLVLGYWQIRRRKRAAHERLMLAAAIITGIFLVSYLTKTWFLGTTVYGGVGWMRTMYLTILFSHLTLAIAVIPMALITLTSALSRRFDRHRRIARWTVPIWLYVCVTGVTVHFLLRPWY